MKPWNDSRGVGYTSDDRRFARENVIFTSLGEGGAIEFHAEVFNVYNQTNFIFPVSSLSNAAFGRYVSNSTAPRVLQFVAKVKFQSGHDLIYDR